MTAVGSSGSTRRWRNWCSRATLPPRRRGWKRICARRSTSFIPNRREPEMAEPALALVKSSPSTARAQIAFDNVALVLGGKAIIDTISLDVAAGEILCVVGASGCGKTTALRLAAGLYQPTSGAVRFEGEAMRSPRREIAVV